MVAYLVVPPLFFVLYGSLKEPSQPFVHGVLTLGNYITTLTSGGSLELFYDTMVYVIFSVILSIALAFVFAWAMVRTDTPNRGILNALLLVPIAFPPFLDAIMWVFLLNPRNGWINLFVMWLFHLNTAPFDVFTMAGMIFVRVISMFPLAYLVISAALMSMDPSLEEASLISGADTKQTMSRVTLKLMTPSLIAAGVLMYMIVIGDYQVPLVIGSSANLHVFASRIFGALSGSAPNYGLATALSSILILFALVGVYFQNVATRGANKYATVSGKGMTNRPMRLGNWRYVTWTILVIFFGITVILPMFTIVYASLVPYFTAPTMQILRNLSLANFVTVTSSSTFIPSLENTVFLGLAAPTIAMLVVAVAAYIVARTSIRGRKVLNYLTLLPLAIPETVLAVGVLWFYLWFRVGIYDTIWILLLAYITRLIPFGSRLVEGNIHQISSELEEESRVCRASHWYTFTHVTLPLIKNGVLMGWSYGVLEFQKEFTMTLFLYTAGTQVLAVLLFSYWSLGLLTVTAAIATIMIAMSIGSLLILRRFFGFRLSSPRFS